MSEKKLVTCPYDEAHKVKESRLQLHIAKCKLNHLDMTKKVCPFNATHLLDGSEFEYHLMHCDDRAPLDRQLSETLDKNNPYKGRTAVPQFSDPHIDDGENWDIDMTRVTVIPSKPPPGAVIEPPPMSKPAERKKLYLGLHRQQQEEPESNKPSPRTEVIRQPKQKSQGEQVTKVEPTNPKIIENLGLGRGRPNRIAANIFDNANNVPPENASYSKMVKDMSNLGLNRGRPVNQVAAAVPIFDHEDFPALGCGRGAFNAPKQSLRTPGVKREN